MNEDRDPSRRFPSRGVAWLLVGGCFASNLLFLVLGPQPMLAGGATIRPGQFCVGLACFGYSIGAFVWCPRHYLVAKSLTFLLLLPVLHLGVDMVIIAVGRCFDPGFGHC